MSRSEDLFFKMMNNLKMPRTIAKQCDDLENHRPTHKSERPVWVTCPYCEGKEPDWHYVDWGSKVWDDPCEECEGTGKVLEE